MTCSLLPREILWRHIFKTKRAISLKFCIRNAFMDIMTHTKFYFNRLMLTLIFSIRASEPPPGPGERLKRPGLIGLNWKMKELQDFFINFHNIIEIGRHHNFKTPVPYILRFDGFFHTPCVNAASLPTGLLEWAVLAYQYIKSHPWPCEVGPTVQNLYLANWISLCQRKTASIKALVSDTLCIKRKDYMQSWRY